MKTLDNVLLVDDNPADNFIHKRILTRSHCAAHIEVALNGAEAINLLKQHLQEHTNLPELVFLDINMPVMNGWEFLEAYAELPLDGTRPPIVVMLTTSLNPSDIARAKDSGLVAEYVDKPLTQETLERLMRTFYPDQG